MRLAQQRLDARAMARRHADARELEQLGVLQEDTRDGRLAVHGRRQRDTQVGFRIADAHVGAPVLRQPPLGDVQPRENLYARDDGRGEVARQALVEAQQAVDAEADAQVVAPGLEMDVGGADLERALEDLVDGADDRRAARQILQRLDGVGVDEFFGELGRGRAACSASRPSRPTRSNSRSSSSKENTQSRGACAERQRHRLDRRALHRGRPRRATRPSPIMKWQHERLRAKIAATGLRWCSAHVGHRLVVAARQVEEFGGERGEVARGRAASTPGALELAYFGADVAARLAVRRSLDAARAQKIQRSSRARLVSCVIRRSVPPVEHIKGLGAAFRGRDDGVDRFFAACGRNGVDAHREGRPAVGLAVGSTPPSSAPSGRRRPSCRRRRRGGRGSPRRRPR